MPELGIVGQGVPSIVILALHLLWRELGIVGQGVPSIVILTLHLLWRELIT